jgi:hypothetical protein
VRDRVGYRRQLKDEGTKYYIFPKQWADELCKGYNDPTGIAKAMAERGLLEPDNVGKMSKPVNIRRKKGRCYVLNQGVLTYTGKPEDLEPPPPPPDERMEEAFRTRNGVFQ